MHDKLVGDPPSMPEVARAAAGEVVDAVNDNLAATIRPNPLQAVAMAVGIGLSWA